MKYIEREMNLFEQFVEKMKDAASRNKRISKVLLTEKEYQDFKTQALDGLSTQDSMTLVQRDTLFGVKLEVK